MFDLPVDTSEERRAYREFRKNLIKEGFIMMQYSVYVRTCPNREYAERLENRLKKIVPAEGNIRTLMITEKQYNEINIIVGSKSMQEEKMAGSERFIII